MKQPFACEHTNQKHYAKGLCRNCYHSKGRKKHANLCDHPERSHYAKGLCKGCYLKLFKAKSKKNYKPR